MIRPVRISTVRCLSPLLRPLLLPALVITALLSVAPAKAALIHTFDDIFIGDDPGGSFTFDLTTPPAQPVAFTFDGYVENLNLTILGHTGVVFGLYWRDAMGAPFPGTAFPTAGVSSLGLPVVEPILGPQRVPVRFTLSPITAPSSVIFYVDGQGPADNFHVVGDLTMEPVPEPGCFAGISLGLAGLALRRRR